MNEMLRMFEGVCGLAQMGGELTEALFYKSNEYSSIEYEKDGVTYSVSIRKENKDA